MISYASNNRPLNSVFLGLGTNLGDKKKNIELAFDKIEEQIGNITSISALYLSKPQGFNSENVFVNCAIHLQTTLSPIKLLSETQLIEKEMGRKDKSNTLAGYADRIIDIDILFYNDIIINNSSTLIIPHPLIQERDFVLKPLSEIAPDLIHPIFNKSIEELLNNIL